MPASTVQQRFQAGLAVSHRPGEQALPVVIEDISEVLALADVRAAAVRGSATGALLSRR